MTLSEWLTSQNMPAARFCEERLDGQVDHRSLSRYMRGQRGLPAQVAWWVFCATDGAVTLDDWAHLWRPDAPAEIPRRPRAKGEARKRRTE